ASPGLPLDAELAPPVVGGEYRAGPAVPLEQLARQTLLVRPRVGEDHVHVRRVESEILVRVRRVRRQPGVVAPGVDAVLRTPRDETAVDELDGEAEVFGQPVGLTHERLLDLDAARLEVEQGGQTRHDPESAAPLAELHAASEVTFRQPPQ